MSDWKPIVDQALAKVDVAAEKFDAANNTGEALAEKHVAMRKLLARAADVHHETIEACAKIVEKLADGYLSDPHKVRCRHVAREIRAMVAPKEGAE